MEVAGAAFGYVLVAVLDERPVRSLVASSAQPFVVIVWIVHQVAAFAVVEAKVVKRRLLPITGTEMAGRATVGGCILGQGLVPGV